MVKKTILTDKEVAFGTGTFYKQDQELVEDQVEVGFGNAKIYYDNAEMLDDFATPGYRSWFWQCSYLCSPTLES